MIIQERKTDNIEMRQPHADRQGQSRGVEKTLCWFPVNSLEHKLRGTLALEPTHTHTHTHTYTHTRCSLLLLLGKVGRGPSLWLQKTLWNWRQDAGGGLNLPVPWRRWRSCRALGEEGAAGTPQSPSAARGAAAAGRGKCCSGLALKVSCPGLTPRWPEGSPCPVY